MPRALRRDHENVDVRRRDDLAIMNIKSMGKDERFPGVQVRRDVRGVHFRLLFVRDQDHDHVPGLRRFGRRQDLQPFLLRRRAAFRTLWKPDDDVHPAVAQVQRMRVSLAPIPDNR